MAETNTGAEEGTQNPAPAAEGTENSPTDSQGAPVFEAGGGEEGGDEGDGDEGGDGEDDEEPEEGDEGEDTIEDDGSDPAVRRDPSYFIGMRHGKKAAKQSGKQTTDKEGEGDEEEEDGDGIHPEDREILSEEVNKAVQPLQEKLTEQEDAQALQNYLTQNPAFKPYEKRIERFMKHPTRKHLPVETVAMEAVGPEGMMKIGARMARGADSKKQTSKSGPSGGPRDASGKAGVWDMPDDQFEEMQNEVRRKA